MGDTHFRSNLIEQTSGLKVEFTTGSFVDVTCGTVTNTGNAVIGGNVTATNATLSGYAAAANVRATSYLRLGTDVYILSSATVGNFTNSGISAAATAVLSVSLATAMGKGTVFINASSNAASRQTMYILYTSSGAVASWCSAINASVLG